MSTSQEDYIKAGYNHCPVCHGDQVECHSINVDGDHAYQEVSCLGCDATWTDEYSLTGYCDLEEGDNDEG